MEASRAAIEKTVVGAYAPIVLVQASDGAEAIARRNGLTVVDLLRPFATASSGLPLRTSSRSFVLNEFNVRLMPPTELAAATVDSVDAHLQRAIGANVPPSAAALTGSSIATQDDAERVLSGKGVSKDKDPSPWYSTYRRFLHSHLRCLPTEQRDCPIMTLVVVSTADTNPMGHAYELASSSALPRPFQAELFDAELPKVFALLHDNGAAAMAAAGGPPGGGGAPRAPADPQAVYRELRQHFGASPCFVLPLNSGMPGFGAPVPDAWGPVMLDPLFNSTLARAAAPAGAVGPSAAALSEAAGAPGAAGGSPYARALLAQAAAPVRGCCLTPDDVTGLRGVMGKVLSEGVVKAMEHRYQALTNSIAANKRSGLGGMVRSFLGRGGGSSGSGGGPPGGGGGVTGLAAGVAGSALSVGSSLLGSVVGGPSSPAPTSGSSEAPGGEGGSDLTSVTLPSGSLEAQLRHLGDLCMAMGDYDGAYAAYSRLRGELRPERSPGYAAAAAEAAGVSLFLAGGPSRDVDQLLDSAVSLYFRAAAAAVSTGISSISAVDAYGLPTLPPLPAPGAPGSSGPAVLTRRLGVRLASRAATFAADAMWAAAAATLGAAGVTASGAAGITALANGGAAAAAQVGFACGRLRDASALLRRVAQAEGDGSLASAILTEQAALMMLRVSPVASTRKAAALLGTAGTLYGQCGMAPLSVRALSLALSAYGPAEGAPTSSSSSAAAGDGGWGLIEDSLTQALAQRLGSVGDPGGACTYLAQLLARSGSRLPQATQRTLLAHLLRSYAAWAGSKEAAAVAAVGGRKAKAVAKTGGDPALSDSEKKAAVAEGASSAVLPACGLPFVEDASFQVSSFSNAWCAALAVHAASNPGTAASAAAGVPSAAGDATTRQMCAGVLERLGLPSSLPLAGPTAAAGPDVLPPLPSASFASLLAETGCGAATAAASQLFAGHLPGEGPPPPRLQAVAGTPWSRITEHCVGRELRTREKLKSAIAAAQAQMAAAAPNGTPSPASLPAPPRYDWRGACHDLAVLLEDEAEQHGRELAQEGSTVGATRSSASASVGAGGLGVLGIDIDGDVHWDGNEKEVLSTGSATAAAAADAGAALLKSHPPASVSTATERYVGEPIAVSVTLRNPLAMELPVIGVTVDHAWLGDAASSADAPAGSLASGSLWVAPHPQGEDGRGGVLSASEVVRAGLACLPVDLLLQPGETRTLRVLVRPLRAGSLVLKGLSWTVAGLVRCAHEFTLRGPPLNDSRNNKAAGARAIDRRLECTVAPGRGWLGVRLAGVASGTPSPAAGPAVLMMDGERRACELHVTNHGCVPVGGSLLLRWEGKGAILAAVHAGGSGAVVASDGIDGGLTRLELGDAAEVRDAQGKPVTLSSLPVAPQDASDSPAAHVSLPPGFTAVWRVSVRGHGPGRHTARAMVWYWPPGTPVLASRSFAGAASPLRCVRLTFRAVVRPSVITTSLIEPAADSAGEYVLTVTATHVAQAPAMLTHAASATAGGAVAVTPLPIAVSGVHVVSDHWQAALCGSSTYTADGALVASGTDAELAAQSSKSWPLGRPLGINETRVLVYRLARRPAPLVGVTAPDGSVSFAKAPRTRPSLRTDGLNDAQVALLRLQRAAAMVSHAVAAGRAKERRARAAAAAQDALPPTLRSIAQERAAAEAAAQRQQEEEAAHDEEETAGLAASSSSVAGPSGGSDSAAPGTPLDDGGATPATPAPGSSLASSGTGSAVGFAVGGGSGGTKASRAADSALRAFPASLDALRGGPAKLHVVVSWSQWADVARAMSDGLVQDDAHSGTGVAVTDVTDGGAAAASAASHSVVGEAYHQDLPTLVGRYLSVSTACDAPPPPSASPASSDVGVCTFLGPSPALLPVGPRGPNAPVAPNDGDDADHAAAAASCYLASVAADPTGGPGSRLVTVYRAPQPHAHYHDGSEAAPVRFSAPPPGGPAAAGKGTGSLVLLEKLAPVGVSASSPVTMPVTGLLTVRQSLWSPNDPAGSSAAAAIDVRQHALPPLVVVPAGTRSTGKD